MQLSNAERAGGGRSPRHRVAEKRASGPESILSELNQAIHAEGGKNKAISEELGLEI
jgi:hypothetical protein